MDDATLLVRATLALYRNAARDAGRALVRNLWIVALPPLYSIALGFVQQLAAPLGMAGGFIMFLAAAACISSFLSVLAEAVAHERIRVGELGQTFGRYVGSIVGVLFLFWIVGLLLMMIKQQNPGMAWLPVVVNLGLFLLCNPLPELVYQGSRDGIGLIDEAVQFMRENWLEWLVPVLATFLPLFVLSVPAALLAMSRTGATTVLELIEATLAAWLPAFVGVPLLLRLAVASVILCWIMLFRGFLFRSLAQSGRRQRVFGARMRGL